MDSVTREDVIKVLKEVYDPEIPVNIVDLGLVYEIHVSGGSRGRDGFRPSMEPRNGY